MEEGKTVPEPKAPEIERIEEDYKPHSMWISEFKERPFEALAFALGAAFVMALLFLSTGKWEEEMKEVLVLLLCATTYGISFGALVSAFLFASAHDGGRSPKPSDMRDLKRVALAGLVSSLLFWPALLLIKLILKA